MDDAQFQRIAKALADPRRLEIIQLISQSGEISCGAIAERFPIGQPTVSHHLKVLAEAGLVRVRREGQHAYFRIQRETSEAYLQELQRRLLPAMAETLREEGSSS